MAKILYIKASPRTGRSHSLAVADAFLEEYRKGHAQDEIVELDLFRADLPAMDGLAVTAKYAVMHGDNPTGLELAAWGTVVKTVEGFKAADKYVMAVPMWNFGIPYRLKQYIDLLVQPGLTFSFTPEEGYKGLVTGKPVFIAYASGGEYVEGTPAASMDYARSYLKAVLGFVGLTDIRTVAVEPTLAQGPDVAKERREAAIARARGMAREF